MPIEPRTYQITLNPKIAARLELIGRGTRVKAEELILFCFLIGLRSFETGDLNMPEKPEILNNLEKES
jgi:hypothetical protein